MTDLFVYGTLKRGQRYHAVLAGAGSLGRRSIDDLRLFDTPWGHPAVVRGPGTVHGEAYRVDDGTLRRVDELEGHPEYMERRLVGRMWVYVWPGPPPGDFVELPAGRWPAPGATRPR